MSILSKFLLLIGASLFAWTLFICVSNVIEGISIQRSWKPLYGEYTAKITGYADRGGVKAKLTSLTAEIRFADGTKKQFTSSRSGSLHLLGIGDQISVLTNTNQLFGQSWDIYEIDSSFELWVKDLLWAIGIICFVIGIPLWSFRTIKRKR